MQNAGYAYGMPDKKIKRCQYPIHPQVQVIVDCSSRELIHRLRDSGATLAEISADTGMSVPQASLVSAGKRELGEAFFRALVRMAASRGLL